MAGFRGWLEGWGDELLHEGGREVDAVDVQAEGVGDGDEHVGGAAFAAAVGGEFGLDQAGAVGAGLITIGVVFGDEGGGGRGGGRGVRRPRLVRWILRG